MDYKIQVVSLDQIETTDRTFQISTNENGNELALSISAIGVVQPPIVIKKNSFYQIICGFRRVAAYRELDKPSIPCRILAPDSPALLCAQIAISDNSYQRSLNIIEQSRAFALIDRFAGEKDDKIEIAAWAGLPHSKKAMNRIRPIAGMPPFLQTAILDGIVAVPVASRIHKWSHKDSLAITGLFCKITPGLNVQRELVVSISEISIRDDVPICQIIGDKAIEGILADNETSTPQKTQAVRTVVKEKRFPELNKAEDAYRQWVKDLKLNPRIQLIPPPFFEGNTYRLALTFNSRKQLRSLQDELSKIIHHTDLLPD